MVGCWSIINAIPLISRGFISGTGEKDTMEPADPGLPTKSVIKWK